MSTTEDTDSRPLVERGIDVKRQQIQGNNVSYTCEACGDKFEGHPGNANTYCSRECMTNSYKGEFSGERYETPCGEDHPRWVDREERECPVCGSVFTARKTSPRVTCSRSCGAIQHGNTMEGQRQVEYEKRECAVNGCDGSIEVRPSSETVTCSEECSLEYRSQRYSGRTIEWGDKIGKSISETIAEKAHRTEWEFDDSLGHVIRSEWERDVANLLKDEEVPYEYEALRLETDDGIYIPDFVTDNAVIEVKGWVTDRCIQKAEYALSNVSKRYVVVGGELPSDVHISWENREEVLNYV